MRPSGAGDGAATFVVAAIGAADHTLFCFQARGIVAVMERLADAACMRRSSRGGSGQRAEGAHERDQQQKSGDPTMHSESDAVEA
ncbi:MAG: hypothetical protein QOF56_3230 [Acidobacteriaceae bacterium]|jgi:hypothetical protein|nr:hypothetical protein [Acidobacteriaceae bacterium]